MTPSADGDPPRIVELNIINGSVYIKDVLRQVTGLPENGTIYGVLNDSQELKLLANKPKAGN